MLLQRLQLCCTAAILSLFFYTPSTAQNDGDALFDTSFVHEIRIISPTNELPGQLYQVWLDNLGGTIPYLAASVSIDGILVDSIGIRIKGGLSAFSAKKPLKIDFDKFVEGQDYDGIKKLNLQNSSMDPTFQRDVLGYQLFRMAGVKAPRAAYARVYYNNYFNGLYVMVEQVDKEFLQDKFADDEGTLYKNKTCETVVEAGEETMAHYNQMNAIANTLNGTDFQNAIEQVLDTDAFLRFFLIEHYIDARDNPMDVNCNFYVYHEPPTDLLYWIPWDLDFALFDGGNYALLQTGSNPVFTKMMQTPHYRQRYLELACEMMQYLFKDEIVHPIIDRNAAIVRPAFNGDPFFTNIVQYEGQTAAMKAFISNQRQSFLQDIANEAFDCPAWTPPAALQALVINEIVASSDTTSGIADPAGGYPDWIELYNNSAEPISLKGYYLSHDRDFLKQWPFPDTAVIGPGAYRIIWADRDLDETGLHANFKLDKSRGELILSYEDFTVIDSLSYGPQTTNIAYARFPNGIGQFVQQAATFAQSNGVSSLSGATQQRGILVFPNPASDQVTIRGGAGARSISLVNALGQTVKQLWSPLEETSLDLRGLPSGTYWLLMAREQDTAVVKVLKLNP